MRTLSFAVAIAIISLVGFSPTLLAQTADPNISAKYAIGEIKTIDAAAKQLTIKTDAGSMVTVSLSDKTSYKKLAPGEQSLTNATDLTFAELAEGDRVMAAIIGGLHDSDAEVRSAAEAGWASRTPRTAMSSERSMTDIQRG